MILLPFTKIIVRFIIVCFWVAVISLLLFLPKLSTFFRTDKSITVFTFPMLLDADFLSNFEKETGIKLHISYYENNDELLVKMKESQGSEYDIIIPSDYAVELLIKEGLLKKIDKSKLTFLKTIDPIFMGQYFDPKNEYSIPYLWETYKIGIKSSFFKGKAPPASWRLIFDETVAPNKIGMINNAREAILIAAFYLFGSIDNLTKHKIEKVRQLLIKQKKWVEVYTDLRADYLLLSGMVSVAVGMSGEIWHATRFDNGLDFLIPQEGTFMVIDSIALPIKSSKDDLVYRFINYLYRSDIVAFHVDKYSLFPVTTNVTLSHYFISSMEKILNETKKLEFFRNVLSEEQLNEIWIELKAN